MLVNGEHRIKFIALRDLKVGEELLFDYGRKFAEKHGLSKKLPKAGSGKRGVLTGDEALDALDGLNPANRDTRGKMSAIRGGHGGSRRGRARKTAPTRVMVAKVKQAIENGEKFDDTTQEEEDDAEEEDDEEEEDDAEEEDDEEEEEDDIGDGRRKRKITRPARYSR
jgi:histone-lysine N-methyltransferase EZH2